MPRTRERLPLPSRAPPAGAPGPRPPARIRLLNGCVPAAAGAAAVAAAAAAAPAQQDDHLAHRAAALQRLERRRQALPRLAHADMRRGQVQGLDLV
jgi:hypothetical protein